MSPYVEVNDSKIFPHPLITVPQYFTELKGKLNELRSVSKFEITDLKFGNYF